jgi:hypothetical protein
MSISLSDCSTSPFLVSNDFEVGTEFPLLAIKSVEMADVPTPGTTKKTRKAIIHFVGGSKGWAANMGCLREIGRALGITKNIDSKWVGARIALKIVGDVRRPDGTKGNAIRIARVEPAINAPATTQPPAENAEQKEQK